MTSNASTPLDSDRADSMMDDLDIFTEPERLTPALPRLGDSNSYDTYFTGPNVRSPEPVQPDQPGYRNTRTRYGLRSNLMLLTQLKDHLV
ncbi:hypothetical protein NDU88_007175 [Pleurodeles waltl]|uniref:Uncharacterized protein n=1 Tax=Pleurodeles waltl TaxID=8319 RepID=A0AAV7U0N4_PLEWA|nr:hypothetical protein NDU88_007175 [Pleurodeles waltl]